MNHVLNSVAFSVYNGKDRQLRCTQLHRIYVGKRVMNLNEVTLARSFGKSVADCGIKQRHANVRTKCLIDEEFSNANSFIVF